MEGQFYNHPLANIHYYRFGSGDEKILCFHGYGMHGRQFRVLEETFGSRYTFYGFDLFFHKKTRLNNQDLETVKGGLEKDTFCRLIESFCEREGIDRFSLISYSLGTHYAGVITEGLAHRINTSIFLAPSFVKPVRILRYMSVSKTGNYLLEKLFLSENGLFSVLKVLNKVRFLDNKSYHILKKEFETPALRFNFYASVTYLRLWSFDEPEFINGINRHNVKCLFIFGRKDKFYPPDIANPVLDQLKFAKKIVLDSDHDMVNEHLAERLVRDLYDN